MKTVKKSTILCLCAALLLTPLLTACDLFNDLETQDTQEAVTEPAPQDCGHEPYRIEAKDGQAEIIFDPCYTKPFVLEIPETDGEGNPITAITCNNRAALLPSIMAEEDFAVFRGGFEKYFGITVEEAVEIIDNPQDPRFSSAFYLWKNMAYFQHMSLDDCDNDSQKEDMIATYPITEKMDVYVLDSYAKDIEIVRTYAYARKAAPELDDVWYSEACARSETTYFSGLGETITEIRWPSQLSEIPELAFVGCSSMESVTIPGTVKTVRVGAFACCDGLQEITFSEGVTNIEEDVLYECLQLKTINLPVSLESLIMFDHTLMIHGCERDLPTINYAGTMAQWGEVVYNSQYEYFDIHCSDGVVKATMTLN